MAKLRSPFMNNETLRYAIAGILFGLMFPVVASMIRIVNSGLPLELTSFGVVQGKDSLLWIIDTAPLFLGFFAALAGRRQDNLQIVYEQLKKRESELENMQKDLELRVEERTSDLIVMNRQMSNRAEQLQQIGRASCRERV